MHNRGKSDRRNYGNDGEPGNRQGEAGHLIRISRWMMMKLGLVKTAMGWGKRHRDNQMSDGGHEPRAHLPWCQSVFPTR